MTTQQHDTAALTDEQLEGVAGSSTSIGNPPPHPTLSVSRPPPSVSPTIVASHVGRLRRAAEQGSMSGR